MSLVAVFAFRRTHGSARAVGNREVFLDSVGEDVDGPDITRVTVSNNRAGVLTFRIAIANRPTLTGKMDIRVSLATDRNTVGWDTILDLRPGSLVAIAPSSGTQSDLSIRRPASLKYSYVNGTATIKVKASDLRNPSRFDFYVFAEANSSDPNSPSDYAPDLGGHTWRYQMTAG